jgi:hypothetical protein
VRTEGYLLLATGPAKYIEMARNLAASIRVMDARRRPVCLVHDEDAELSPDDRRFFDDYAVLPNDPLYPGFMNDCFFHKEHALCLTRKPDVEDGLEAAGPFWARCDPVRCPNSSITQRHLPALRASKADAETMLKAPGQSPLQRSAVQNAIAQVDGLIAKVAVG